VSPSVATFLFEVANFVALAALLGWIFFRPVQASIERRRASLEGARREVEQMREAAKRELADVDARRRAVEASLEPLREEARREAERRATTIVEAAQSQAAEERARLDADLAARRREHARTLTRDAAAAARTLVVRLLAQIEGPDLDAALARAACRRLTALAGTNGAGVVEVETARPLDAETLNLLREAAGPGATVKDRVIPELGAGVRVISGAGLIDASVAGLAAWAEQELVARLESDEGADG
jgi:F0F1-type ATP synthase membrane subunit b/b'